LTLSSRSNSLYTVGVQDFTITQPTTINEDGFSNINGYINKDNTDYIFALGPIFVRNTIYDFNDSSSYYTVESVEDINEMMVSKTFRLSNNDTLILGAMGYYIMSQGAQHSPIKYSVNLVYNHNDQIFQELFRDTINVEDTANIDFLRGFIIQNIPNGADSFYVQMVIDTTGNTDATAGLDGIYNDNSGIGDNMRNYKTKIVYGNQKPGNNMITNIPKSFELSQNYPNPFNPTTTIKYQIPKDAFVSIKIYDILGREIYSLVNENKQAGYYSVNFNGSNLASGIYFYRIKAGDYVNVKRMALIK
jgi:hypothetical protein